MTWDCMGPGVVRRGFDGFNEFNLMGVLVVNKLGTSSYTNLLCSLGLADGELGTGECSSRNHPKYSDQLDTNLPKGISVGQEPNCCGCCLWLEPMKALAWGVTGM